MTGRWRDGIRLLAANMPPARGLLPLAALLAVWQGIEPGPSPYFPGPAEWWSSTLPLFLHGQLLPAIAATFQTFVEGLVLAILGGMGLGLLIGVSVPVRRTLEPLLEFFRALPPPAMVPVAVLLLGYAESMKLAVVALAAIWPILLNTGTAATRVEPLVLDVARSFRMSGLDRLRKIVVPSVIPAALIGIRVSIPLAIVVTLLVEMLTSMPGIGALMIMATRNFQSAQVYGLLVLVGLLGFVVNGIFSMIETVVLRRWPPRAGAVS